MIENSVKWERAGREVARTVFLLLFDKKILRAEFIACFADTAVVARIVFTMLFENRRAETHSF